MEIIGTIVGVLPVQTGTSARGEWKKQTIIIETEGNYPKKVCLTIWGDKIDPAALTPGSKMNFSIEIESREYNGRWYTDVKAWRFQPLESGPVPVEEDWSANAPLPDKEDDLPF